MFSISVKLKKKWEILVYSRVFLYETFGLHTKVFK